VFLTGLGIGSTVGASLAKSVARPRVAFGWCQMLICGAIAWAAYQMFESLPFWPINPSISSQLNGTVNADAFNFQLDLVRCFWVVLPGRNALGRELPAGARGRGFEGPGSGRSSSAAFTRPTPSARSSARCSQPAARVVARLAARDAGDDGSLGVVGPADAGAGRQRKATASRASAGDRRFC
jgi:spermidine synthase